MVNPSEQLREYETIYVLRPDIDDVVAKEAMLKFKGVVEKKGGINIKVSNWGRRRLAWERNKHQRGLYVHHAYLGQPGIVEEFERTIGIDENVILRQSIVVSKSVLPSDRMPEEDQLDPPPARERKEVPRPMHTRYNGRHDDDD